MYDQQVGVYYIDHINSEYTTQKHRVIHWSNDSSMTESQMSYHLAFLNVITDLYRVICLLAEKGTCHCFESSKLGISRQGIKYFQVQMIEVKSRVIGAKVQVELQVFFKISAAGVKMLALYILANH